jgi:serine protease Do
MTDRYQTTRFKRFLCKKTGILSALILMVLTALITSITVGNIMSRNFSAQIKINDLRNSRISRPFKDGNILKAALPGEVPLVVGIAQKAGPSIVGVRVTIPSAINRFFENNENNTRGAEGSGIIISRDGYILTNYHVVQEADPRYDPEKETSLQVFLPDKRRADAKFVGGDSLNDLAVIKINLKKLPIAVLGDSSKLKTGALAVAIGNPLGLEFAGSVTSGVISALNRTVMVEDRALELIQTDAAINPGNSGGALVNSEGKVIGVNTVKISVPGVEGIGFAIPINNAKPIVGQLIKYGYVKGRPFIGISGREITMEIAERYDLPRGIYVLEVTEGSGADRAGIRKKDIIVSLAGKTITSMQQLNNVKKAYKAGETVKIVIVRNNRRITFNLTFSEAR